jgi:hypothetical protein
MGPYMARGLGCTLVAVCSFVWDSKTQHIKIRERDVTSALGGHLLVGQHNNQPKVGVLGRRDIGEGARPGRNMWGGRRTIVWGGKLRDEKIKINKIHGGLKRPPINISNTTTDQKYVGMTEERKARIFNRVGVWGKHDSIVLGAIELGGDKKLK